MNPSRSNAPAPTLPNPWEALGCLEDPFRVRFDERFVYLGHDQKRGFQRLIDGVRAGECLSLITGGAGTGKTTLVSQLAAELNASSPVVFFFATPPQSLASLLKGCREQTGEAVGSASGGSASGTSTPEAELRTLLSAFDAPALPLLLIDEAQSLGDELLGDLLALAAPRTGGERLLQIVLAGDPSLVKPLQAEAFRSLGCPLGYHYRVPALPRPELYAFIRHRLSAAGCENCEPFSDEAVERIAHYANGVVGTVNTLCRLALFFSAKTGEARISASSVDRGASTALLKAPIPGLSAPRMTDALGPEQSPVPAHGLRADVTDVRVPERVAGAPPPASRSNTQAAVCLTTAPGAPSTARDRELSHRGKNAMHRRSGAGRWLRLAAAMSVLVATVALLAFHVSSLHHRPQREVVGLDVKALPELPVPLDSVAKQAAHFVGSGSAGVDGEQAETPAVAKTDSVSQSAPDEAGPANDEGNQESAAPATTALRIEMKVADAADVEQLLARAQAHFDADRLVAPRFDNALAVYRRILHEHPGNASARDGLAAIRARLLDYARVESARGDAVSARSHMQKVRAIDEEWGRVGDEVSQLTGGARDIELKLSPPRNLRPTTNTESDR